MGSSMDIHFGEMNSDTKESIPWPKRGRTKVPLPEPLVAALHNSYANGSTPNLLLPEDQKTTFTNLLAKAGKELNYRIEKLWDYENAPDDFIRVFFRVSGLRDKNAGSK